MAVFLLFCAVMGLLTISKATEMKLTLLAPQTKGGQCLDGSSAGFYYSPPPSGSSNLWVIFVEGGGSCSDEQSCMQRANTSLGSSKYWNTTTDTSQINLAGVLSDDPNINPDFYSGHRVFCPYCSGDAWTGQRYSPSTDPDTWGLYFSGHLLVENIMQYLSKHLNILNAQYVLLTGGSAGGVGTFANIDWLSTQFKEKGNYKNVTVKGAPVAGWFFSGNSTDELNNPMMPPNDYPHWLDHQNGGRGHNASMLWDSYLYPSCVAALGTNLSWHCGSVHNLYQFITTPIFVMQNKFDKNQIESSFLLPDPKNTVNANTTAYVKYFGVDTDRSIITQMIDISNDKNGLFYGSCFVHTGGLGIGINVFTKNVKMTIINGYNASELVGDWFWERNKLPHFVYDTCNNNRNELPCNPTCNSYP